MKLELAEKCYLGEEGRFAFGHVKILISEHHCHLII